MSRDGDVLVECRGIPRTDDQPQPVLALAGLEAALGLVDHIDPALAANETVVAMTAAQGLQRVPDFHCIKP